MRTLSKVCTSVLLRRGVSEFFMNSIPLKAGDLAPNFSLADGSGQTVTRSQFRNRAGLALIFASDLSDLVVRDLLNGIQRDQDAYQKLGAQTFVITPTSHESPLPTLIDANSTTWQRYAQTSEPGYGLFVLDRYGGVDSQIVSSAPADLPDAPTVLEWVRAAMYRCNI